MRIKIQFKNNIVALTGYASTFGELSRVVEDRLKVRLPEDGEIHFFDEIDKVWRSLDEELYKNLIEKVQSFDEIKLRVEEKDFEESSNLTFSCRENENSEYEISQEKFLESKHILIQVN